MILVVCSFSSACAAVSISERQSQRMLKLLEEEGGIVGSPVTSKVSTLQYMEEENRLVDRHPTLLVLPTGEIVV